MFFRVEDLQKELSLILDYVMSEYTGVLSIPLRKSFFFKSKR